MRELKVWGGLTSVRGKQLRTIVATRTKKRAIELLNTSTYNFNDYWCETGNEVELATALPMPEVVFMASSTMGKDFKPVGQEALK